MITGKIEFTGTTTDDAVFAVLEASRRIREGFTSGHDRNEDGSFVFELTESVT